MLRLCKRLHAVDHVVVEDQAIRFRRLDDAVQQGTGLGTVGGVREQPILSANDQRFYRPLSAIVVDRQMAIIHIAYQLRSLAQRVLNRFTQRTRLEHFLRG